MFIKYINLFFISWVFLLTTSCGMFVNPSDDSNAAKANSNLILVEIAPEGRQPEVFYNDHEAICRRGMPNPNEYGLDRPETEEEGEAAVGGEGADPGAQEERDVTTTVNVSSHWFSIGLQIANRSEEYFLVIEQLVFIMSAQWGSELLTGRKEISSGYCGTDPLYIIQPNIRLRYEPSRKNYINNLTIFVDGVPFPTGPQISQQSPGAGGVNAGAQPGGQQPAGGQQPGGAAQQAPGVGALSQNDEYVPDTLPSYRVQLVLHGYFIDKTRKYIANFKKEVFFSTTSAFFQ